MLARKGSESAQAELDGPECPEAFEYLVSWAFALHARSGIGLAGADPLRYSELREWANLVIPGIALEAYEVEALIALDAAMREDSDKKQEEEETPADDLEAWPTRAPGVKPVLIRDTDD